MQKYLLLIATVSVLAGCSTTPEYVDSAQYCYTTENITVQDKQTVNSQTKVECSDKPRAEHFVNISYNALSIFNSSKEKSVLQNLTSFSLERSF